MLNFHHSSFVKLILTEVFKKGWETWCFFAWCFFAHTVWFILLREKKNFLIKKKCITSVRNTFIWVNFISVLSYNYTIVLSFIAIETEYLLGVSKWFFFNVIFIIIFQVFVRWKTLVIRKKFQQNINNDVFMLNCSPKLYFINILIRTDLRAIVFSFIRCGTFIESSINAGNFTVYIIQF